MALRRALLAVPLLAGFLSLGQAEAAVQFSISPHTARAAGKVVVKAAHLSPRSQYLLLLVPDANKKLERLMGAEVTDERGNFSAKLALPAVPYCGSANVYLMTTKKTIAHTAIKITGCNPGSVPPPPPPHR